MHDLVAGAHPGLPVDKVLTPSDPSPALLAAAATASLLVIGTHHHGVVAGALLGSVGRDAVLTSFAPVCVVPQWAPAEDARRESLER